MNNEVVAARLELGNIMRLLNDLTDRLVLVAGLLNRVAPPGLTGDSSAP